MWVMLSVVCFIGAIYFWRMGDEEARRAAGVGKGRIRGLGQRMEVEEVKGAGTRASGVSGHKGKGWVGIKAQDGLKYRLSNTKESVGQLSREERGILLENALIDTRESWAPQIPAELRARGEAGAYIVQSKGPIDEGFREALKGVGGQVISYIPNDAYLVRGREGALKGLLGGEAVAVIAYEPYYKLSLELLAGEMEGGLGEGQEELNVVMYGDEAQGTQKGLEGMGVEVEGRSESPFGPVLRVKASGGKVVEIAGMSGVERVERVHGRMVANDLSRARMGVALDTQSVSNYLGLSGRNVVVAVNDSGVDTNHPDLAGRVFSDVGISLTDSNGHGTHVAGIIAGNGTNSITVTNAIGSLMPGVTNQFRGMAPEAQIYSQPVMSGAVYRSDFELQEAAGRTNALISNNSWNYGGSDYDIEAASYDAAVRDTEPEVSGGQGMVYVFSAGNAGNGQDDGSGVTPGSILSPGTAKNVITVGALEQPRNITNEVVIAGQTNRFWSGETDSENEVAGFSSRGNVGIGVEGDFGRYKPDVVAPGVFVVSTRSTEWDKGSYYNPTNYHINSFVDEVGGKAVQGYPIALPYNAVGDVSIEAFALYQALDIPIYLRYSGGFPRTNLYDVLRTNQLVVGVSGVLPATWFYGIGNPTNVTLHYGVTTEYTTTNDNGNELEVLSNLNETIGKPGGTGPWYRYESGTSMAAAGVSGVLALLEDYFTNRLGMRPSGALLKAMLINGSRSVNTMYDFEVKKGLNDEGWGVVNVTNSLPEGITNGLNRSAGTPVLLFDQSVSNAVATGQSRTVRVQVGESARSKPLRVTLVWTDPPGNPAAGLKLVNDLDLVVTNEGSGQVYWGNDIAAGSTINTAWDTNSGAQPGQCEQRGERVFEGWAGDQLRCERGGASGECERGERAHQPGGAGLCVGDIERGGGVGNALSVTNGGRLGAEQHGVGDGDHQ